MQLKTQIREWARSVLRTPADMLIASSSNLGFHVDKLLRRTGALHDNPAVAALIYPPSSGREDWSRLEGIDEHTRVEGESFPVPPERLMEGYGPTARRYLDSSNEHFSTMKRLLEESGLEFRASSLRGLDFGCAAGRLIRHFAPYARPKQFFGVDISVSHISWCQRHLSWPSPFHFINTTTFPYLPFADGAFDLIYSGSVFTHIADLSDMWMMELSRLLAPGGRLYITLHDRHTINLLREHHPDFFLTHLVEDYQRETQFLDREFGMVSLRRSAKDAMVFYDEPFVRSHWSKFLDIVSYTPHAYGFQSAIVLKKPE